MRQNPRLDTIAIEALDAKQLDASIFNAQRGFLRNLQAMYEKYGEDGAISVLRIEDELKDMLLRGGMLGTLLVAAFPSERSEVLGSAYLIGIDAISCELKFLWVEPPYRDHGIASKIFRRAVEVAKRHGCTKVYAELHTALKDVIKMLIDHDFTFTSERQPSAGGRYVFVHNIEPAASSLPVPAS
jgi:GNAT superfamily N-acetyltransferase